MTILKIEAYKYEELNDVARKMLKQEALENISEMNDYMFREDTNSFLKDELNQDFLNVKYSLSYSQGDGLRVTGELDLAECLKYKEINQALTSKELKRISHYLNETLNTTEISNINGYSDYYYFSEHDYDFADEIIGYLEDALYTNIDIDLINKFQKLIINFFEQKCRDWEKEGYDYIYPDLTEEDLAEYYYDYYFDKNGHELDKYSCVA